MWHQSSTTIFLKMQFIKRFEHQHKYPYMYHNMYKYTRFFSLALHCHARHSHSTQTSHTAGRRAHTHTTHAHTLTHINETKHIGHHNIAHAWMPICAHTPHTELTSWEHGIFVQFHTSGHSTVAERIMIRYAYPLSPHLSIVISALRVYMCSATAEGY